MYTKRNTRRVPWHSHTAYTYGSAAYQEEEIRERQQKQPVNTKKQEKDAEILRHQVVLLAVLGVLFYFGNVALSENYITKSNALIQLKKQEAECLDRNEALKIDVERLRSPERITSIAKKELGMTTARSNIYVRMKNGQSAK